VSHPILAVGVRGFKLPLRVFDPERGSQAVTAAVTLTTDLAADKRGSHLSRLCSLAVDLGERTVSRQTVEETARQAAACLNARRARVEIAFDYFIDRPSPVSRLRAPFDCPVRLVGRLRDGRAASWLDVTVGYMSLCPCSRAISRWGAHNQRSAMRLRVWPAAPIWVNDLVELVEGCASSPLFNLLKRVDEKHVTEASYASPRFVEDMVREVGALLSRDRRVARFIADCRHYESVHQFDAVARSGGRGAAPGRGGDGAL